MDTNYLISGPISKDTISRLIDKAGEKKGAGGHMIFLGQVRADEYEGKKVKAIEYSAYEELVSTEAEKIRKAVTAEFIDVKSIDIVHATGVVNAGEISMLVFVSAGHRVAAMQACSKTVELIKEKLPVWKKEIFEDNSFSWK